MRRNWIFLPIVIFSFTTLFSQQDEILINISGPRNETVTKSEFKRIYTKNNKSASSKKKSVNDYMNLFVNFKLKVTEAEMLGYDTTKSFINEFKGYRNQLAKPYLTSDEKRTELISEAYDRMRTRIRAAHILVKIDFNTAQPDDTLEAYNRIMDARNRFIAGEDFGEIAIDVSEDPSVARNRGDLGYFSAFKFPYDFETEVYKTALGDLSMPFRTRFGYHIVFVSSIKPNLGEVKVAHIIKVVPPDASPEFADSIKALVEAIQTQLNNGGDFSALVSQYSDDKRTAANGGELPWFGTGRMIPEFEDLCFELKNKGDISAPLKTVYGWHIVKLLDSKAMKTFDEAKPEIEKNLEKPEYAKIIRNHYVSGLKKSYNFQVENSNLSEFYSLIDSSFFNSIPAKNDADLEKTLIKFANKIYSQQDFMNYLSKIPNKSNYSTYTIQRFINEQFQQFVDEKIIQFEDENLERKNDAFRFLVEEYHDGILLFNIMDEKIWSKAVRDTTGLQNFYETNKSKYIWDRRIDASVYTCNNAKIAKQIIKNFKKNPLTDEALVEEYNNLKSPGDTIFFTRNTFLKGDNPLTDKTKWAKGISSLLGDNSNLHFVVVHEVINPETKTLKECKGIAISDYQEFLEKEWIKELKAKYSVEINQEVLDKVINEL